MLKKTNLCLNILKVKLLKILGCCIKQNLIWIRIRFCHFIILISFPILAMGVLHGKVQLGQTLKIYTVNRSMISKLYIIRIRCHITLFKECKVLIIYQACICKNLLFMHQINSDTISSIIFNKFNKPTHNYPTNFAKTYYGISPFKLSKSKYRNSVRGPTLWNNIPINTEEKQQKNNISLKP